MPSILSEYLNKKLGILELQKELQRLIGAYNKHTGRCMFVYAADINKNRTQRIDVSLVQDDFYTIQDILRESKEKKIDFYIETPGGSGEAAEEIAKFLRKKFNEVNFVIAGESKSAGTILALSGDNIYMTDSGSLGPIDAQVKIGRSIISAHDYKAWIDEKRDEAAKAGKLNPLDALMVAQISPGEIYGVVNSLEFAKDLVKEWLEKYKFKNWVKTKGKGVEVTEEMRKKRATEVAEMLCDHTTWRTHGRSLKIEDFQDVLLIERIDDDPTLSDIVHRIHTVIRIIFDSSVIYKMYFLADFQLAKTYSVGTSQNNPVPITGNKNIEAAELNITCPKCKKQHPVIGYLDIDSNGIKTKNLKTNPNIQDNDIFICDSCKYSLDLKPIKAQFENQTRRKLTFK